MGAASLTTRRPSNWCLSRSSASCIHIWWHSSETQHCHLAKTGAEAAPREGVSGGETSKHMKQCEVKLESARGKKRCTKKGGTCRKDSSTTQHHSISKEKHLSSPDGEISSQVDKDEGRGQVAVAGARCAHKLGRLHMNMSSCRNAPHCQVEHSAASRPVRSMRQVSGCHSHMHAYCLCRKHA